MIGKWSNVLLVDGMAYDRTLHNTRVHDGSGRHQLHAGGAAAISPNPCSHLPGLCQSALLRMPHLRQWHLLCLSKFAKPSLLMCYRRAITTRTHRSMWGNDTARDSAPLSRFRTRRAAQRKVSHGFPIRTCQNKDLRRRFVGKPTKACSSSRATQAHPAPFRASGPILTFVPHLGRHFCKCPNRRTTSKVKLLVEPFGFDVRMENSGQLGSERQILSTSIRSTRLSSSLKIPHIHNFNFHSLSFEPSINRSHAKICRVHLSE